MTNNLASFLLPAMAKTFLEMTVSMSYIIFWSLPGAVQYELNGFVTGKVFQLI